MSSNWVSAFDMLAAGGVIDFDAPAYVLGEQPRYAGHPNLEQLPTLNPMLPKGTKLKDITDKDLFEKTNDGKLIHNPKWKKFLFGAIAVVGTVAALIFGKKAYSAIKSMKMPKIEFVKFDKFKDLWTKTWAGIKKPFVWVTNKFKKP